VLRSKAALRISFGEVDARIKWLGAADIAQDAVANVDGRETVVSKDDAKSNNSPA
jgi:hypothetical protein